MHNTRYLRKLTDGSLYIWSLPLSKLADMKECDAKGRLIADSTPEETIDDIALDELEAAEKAAEAAAAQEAADRIEKDNAEAAAEDAKKVDTDPPAKTDPKVVIDEFTDRKALDAYIETTYGVKLDGRMNLEKMQVAALEVANTTAPIV